MINIPGMDNMPDMGNVINTIKGKVHFPADKLSISQAIDSIPDIPQPAKDFVKNKIPDKTYGSIDDLKKALNI